jgi:hypothetical protein
MRWPAIAVLAAAGLAATAVGCGDDDQEGEPVADASEATGTTGGGEEAGEAAGVELTATVFREGQRLSFDYTLANTGSEPIAVVDTLAVMDQLEPLDGGAYRIVYARTTGDAAAGSPSPLPDQQGKVVTPDGQLATTARVTGDWDEVPPEVELCIEVVPPPWTDAGGGVATFPYRAPDAEPALACSGRLPAP